ncbi:MAG: TVP38/TMEM64 family protein [Acetatifactor sp.]
MSRPVSHAPLKLISVLGLTFCICLGFWGIHTGVLTSQQQLEKVISEAGPVGPALFTAFQAVQVVLPILPGGIGCLVGVILFGTIKGFLYNYIGICIGSFIAFGVAKNCGRPLLLTLFGAKLVSKYDGWTEERARFDRLFALAIFLPVAPDDFLCYLAGTTTMTWGKFVAIILLGKPLAIFLYSVLLSTSWTHVLACMK